MTFPSKEAEEFYYAGVRNMFASSALVGLCQKHENVTVMATTAFNIADRMMKEMKDREQTRSDHEDN